MTVININKKVFSTLISKKLADDFLKDRISMLGTDLEEINSNEIIVEIFPNRPDMLSEQGFARAFSSFIGVKTGLKKYNVKSSGEKVIIEDSVSKVRPFTACAIVKNLHLDNEKIKEMINIQEKLHQTFCRNRKKAAIGIYPFEKIKAPIYYKAMKPEEIKFIPLESNSAMNGAQILRSHPCGRGYGHLLEGKEKYPVFVDSNNEILSMPPIINSKRTGKVDENTKDIFIECSGFDFAVLNKLLNIIVAMFADMGGEIYSMELIYGKKKFTTPDLTPQEIKIDIDYVNKILGLDLSEKDIKKLLEKMGYGYSNKKALVPAYRADVLHQIDIVEDIAIAYGYENFNEEIPKISTTASESKKEKFIKKTAEVLIGLGLIETASYHLSNVDVQSKKMIHKTELIELANALTAEYNACRAWMLPNLMNILEENTHNEYPQNIFEIGACFKKDIKSETGVSEFKSLGIALCNEDADFTRIKQVLDALSRAFSFKYEIKEVEHSSFISGRTGSIFVEAHEIGILGEINPTVINNFAVKMPVAALEINFDKLFEI